MKKIKLSKNMAHTWFIDLDGSILKHNGYIIDKKDTLLKGVKNFLNKFLKMIKSLLLLVEKEIT